MIKLKGKIILFNKTTKQKISKIEAKNAVRRKVQTNNRPSIEVLRLHLQGSSAVALE
jgi:hypothetical protein